ncbi:putative RNA-binding protein 18 [Hypsizygus marmoreus]|uniref:Probable RNA-binding protein 18 n=1 Tax=Hypsizygus marmoreus TaxID=39966 RepID=A0A369JWU3_HYPMA|nr:putative RNA-binding protein 18 [Hypsizygus marmoreus]
MDLDTGSPSPGPLATTSKSPTPSPASPNEHLSFPSTAPESQAESSTTPAAQSRQLLKDRLYIGNLHPSVDEYTLLQIFSKFGKVTKLDFLFHKAGALKGKPRGYAFVEYGSNHEALKALGAAHGKLLRGRKLVVTFAHQAPIELMGSGQTVKRKSMMEVGRPTTLSMLKTGMGARHDGTRDKIAMMEAKLRQMESTNPKPAPKPTSSESSPQPSSSFSMPYHPSSLPHKPPPSVPEGLRLPQQSTTRSAPKPKTPLPSLPIAPPSRSTLSDSKPGTVTAPVRQAKTSKLTGVKIGKPKPKPAPPPAEAG